MSRPRRAETKVVPTRAPEERPGPVGGARDRRRRELTARIASRALERFIADGVEGVSVDEIASAAGIAKGSFYTYFDDKPALVRALVRTVADPVRAAMDRCGEALSAAVDGASLRAAYFQLAGELAAAVLAEPAVVTLYLQERCGTSTGARTPLVELADEIHDRAVALTRAARSHGLIKDLDPEVTATAVVGAAEALILRALSRRTRFDAAAVTEALIAMVVDGIANPAHVRAIGASR